MLRTLNDLAHDLRFGLRSLRHTPTFTVTAVLILALGIGMATTIFTIFRAVVIQDLPVNAPDRLVSLWTHGDDPTVPLPVLQRQVDALRRESRTLQDAAGVAHWGAAPSLLMGEDRRIVLNQAFVTAGFFDVLGARPVLGRLLRPEDGYEGAVPAAVLSHQAWQRQFGGDPGVLGRRLTRTLNQVTYTIVGVAPPGLDFPVGTELWTVPQPIDLVNVVARLAPGATPEAARSEFLSIIRVLDRERRIPVNPVGATVETLGDAVLANARPILVALTGAVALLLLIACVNVGNLLFMRATLRSRDIVIRRALGAGYGRVARMLLVESLLLGTAGGAFGHACTVALLRVLVALAPARFPRMDMVALAGTPVAAAIGVTVLAVLLFGVLPALAAARGNLASALRLDTRSGTGTRQRRRVRQSLVASQVALALILLVGAGLLVRSLQRLQRLEVGYDTDRLAVVRVAIPLKSYTGSRAEYVAMFEEVFRRLRAVPGVSALTPVLYPPFGGANLMQAPIVLEGQSEAEAEANPPVPLEAGGSDYFRTFGIPILRGRGFLESDRRDAPRVVVVSESIARRFWPGEDPIGKRLRLAGSPVWSTVVGVAGDIRYRRLREPTPTIFLPWRQLTTFGVVAVRTRVDFAAVLPAMRRAVRDFDSRMDVVRAGTMDDYLASGPLARARSSALLLSGFGLVALLLASIGLYGVMALAVRERTHDLGIRMALGATPGRLGRDILRGALTVTALGAAVGLGVALAGSRLLAALLFDVSPTDPATFAGVCVLLTAVALVAAYLPARRATRVNPTRALRAD